DFLRRDDTQSHLVATDLHHRHDDVVVDDDALIFFPGQYQHRRVSFSKPRGRSCDWLLSTNEQQINVNPSTTSDPASPACLPAVQNGIAGGSVLRHPSWHVTVWRGERAGGQAGSIGLPRAVHGW